MVPEAHGKNPDGRESSGGGAVRAGTAADPMNSREGGTAKGAAARSCAACRGESDPGTMIRWVRSPSGEVAPDLGRSAFGRGAWLHADPRCLGKLTAALSRSIRAPVTTS